MDNIKTIEVKCSNPNCKAWIPSGISFTDMNSFDSSQLHENQMTCTVCQKMTSCNKENMRVKSNNGGFRGDDTF